MIFIHALNKSYGSKQILFDIDIQFESGKVYGIVGRNGAGKTTFFRCIAGLEKHTGEIQSDKTPLKNHLGYLPTDPYFFDKMMGREYLQLLLNARELPCPDLDSKNIFDLPLDHYASTYSTGMKKKLAFTGILIQQNDVLILDEPFNGVDIQSNIIIQEIIHRLKILGKTIIISSHIFATLKDTCDHIFLLDAGQVTKSVARDGYSALENDLKGVLMDDRIDRMGLL